MRAKLLSMAVALVALATAAPALADGGGGAGGAQAGLQGSTTTQTAIGAALSNQNAVNANVPVSIAGGNVTGGPSSATQTATSSASTDVSNRAKTDQDQNQQQNIGGSGCYAGCGGAGGFQAGVQNAQTDQTALGLSVSKQNAVNANVPVSIAGGNVNSGPSSATQTASSSATTDVSNKAKTDQDQDLGQNIGGGSCSLGCGGAGGFQAGVQNAQTNQTAAGAAVSNQNAVNANVPVSIAGGNVSSGPSSATQTATSNATTDVSNKAKTDQDQHLSQNIGGGSCRLGCGGAGGFQAGVQNATTDQTAIGIAKSDQTAVNANVPVSIAGGNVSSGPSSATQTATSTATADVSNKAKTDQDQHLSQNIGGGSCLAGCGGPGGFQLGIQNAETNQGALGIAKSDQTAVNANTPVSIAGGNISSGPSSATQTATSNAYTDVSNKAKTDQDQGLEQNIGGKDCGCDKKGHDDGLSAGSGGAGGFQAGLQNAETNQWAAGAAFSNQNAVNGNSPFSTAGGNISSGPSSATQTATSNATTDVSNKSKTDQDQWLHQDLGGKDCGCDRKGHDDLSAGSGGAGGFQAGVQNAQTNQWALGISASNQNAVNGNSPSSTAGGNIASGPSSATQTATSNAYTDVSNKAKTDQEQGLEQNIGGSKDGGGCGCKSGHDDGLSAGSGGAGGFQLGIQNAETNQWAAGAAFSNQNAVNSNAPSSTAGGNIYSGPSSATQTATSSATTDVSNRAKTDQSQWQRQQLPVSRI